MTPCIPVREGYITVRGGEGLNGQHLSLEQRQKLVLSPQLRQALAVLQLPLIGLSQLVQQELSENPVLEIQEEPDIRAEAPAQKEPDWLEFFGDCSDVGYIPGERREESPSYPEYVGAASGGLFDYLLFQLHVCGAPAELQVLGEYLIGCLDGRGYLSFPVAELAAAVGCPVEKVEEALALVQSLDPPGVGARSLEECLLLQLRRLREEAARAPEGERDDGKEEALALAEEVVRHHLMDVADGRLDRIAHHLGVSSTLVRQAVEAVRGLDPRPGLAFGGQQDIRYVQPDVVVERVGHDYVVLVNDWGVPRLGVSRYYRRVLQSEGADEATRAYLQDRMRRAVWFLRSIEQRRHTLHRVAEAIFQFQRGFLDRGWSGLRPLTLREVAQVAECHESTVSRAVSGKYAQTPRGIFALRFFFPSALGGQWGQAVAAASAKKVLQELIAGEDPGSPYSDEQLVRLLAEKGIHLSRRTVAKYRGEMGLISSARRRR